MLSGLQQQLTQQQSAVASEVAFLQQYAHALSAQSWGSQLRWEPSNQWQCQKQGNDWRACVLTLETGEGIMATQKLSDSEIIPITLWRWGHVENSRWRVTPHGWLDFCPLSEGVLCLLPE